MATYRTSFAGGGTSGSGDRTVTITPAVGDLVVVFASTSGNTNASPTCTDNNSGTYDRIGTAAWGTSANTFSVFVRTALMANTTSTVITVATGANTAGEIVAVCVSGMSRVGASAVRSQGSQANQAASTTPAPALNQAALTSNITLGAIANSTNPATLTAPTGWTERQDVGQNTPTTGLEVVTRDSGFTGTTVTWGSTSGSVFASFILELDTGIGGSLSATLGDVTSSSSGTVAVSGSSAVTLDAATAAATGAVAIQGSAAVTLDALTASATGTVQSSGPQGTADIALGALTGSATATVDVQGTAAVTLGAMTSSAAGTVAIQSSATITLSATTSSATGTVAVQGASNVTLAALTASATGTVAVQGSFATTLGALVATASGTVAVSGALNAPLGTLSLAATGTGTLDTPGVLNVTLSALTASATAAVAVTGTSTTTLGALTSTAAGTVAVTGAFSSTLSPLGSSAAATVAVQGAGTANLGALTLTADGTVVSPGIQGSLAGTLGVLTASAAATVAVQGALVTSLGALTCAAAGNVPIAGTLATTLGSLSLTASGPQGNSHLTFAYAGPCWVYLEGEHTECDCDLAWQATIVNTYSDGQLVHVFHLKTGDTLPAMVAYLKNANGSSADLTGATVQLIWQREAADWGPANTAVVYTGNATVVDAANGIVRYDWQIGDTNAAGTYRFEWRATFLNGSQETFPNLGYNRIVIDERIA